MTDENELSFPLLALTENPEDRNPRYSDSAVTYRSLDRLTSTEL
jgi:hypothetical protein